MKKLKISSIIVMILVLLIPLTIKADVEEVNEKYNGEYSIDYLLRNYNVVTFGMNENLHLDTVKDYLVDVKGNADTSIEGPMIINGDYKNDNYSDLELEYGIKNPSKVASFIKGTKSDQISYAGKISTNKDFIDFDKLYKQVLAESNTLADKTEYHINSKKMEISKPGIYQINSTLFNSFNYDRYNGRAENFYYTYDYTFRNRVVKQIYIDNYDPNSYYVFNNMKLYEYDNYVVQIKKQGESTFEYLEDYIKTGEYTGNIIFNFPKAKMVLVTTYSGKIIAPQADILLQDTYLNSALFYDEYKYLSYHDSMFVNSISTVFTEVYDEQAHGYKELESVVSFTPYTATQKLSLNTQETKNIIDYDDDLYNGSYSIEEMLKNYNLVTLDGDARIFHIAGQFLINGELNALRLDLESNRWHESSYNSRAYVDYSNYNYQGESFKRWGDEDPNTGTNSVVYEQNNYSNYSYDRLIYDSKPFINYERLYNTITKQQKEIEKGTKVSSEGGIAHIKVGGNYYIENINELDEIVFDNFEANENKLTVITILNTGDLYFPRLSQTATGNYVPTKDYYGKEEARFEYEYYNFPDDIYHGNIIWNVPNATYIELAPYAPFFGHLVAPNADLETPETHFSGSFIVNSLYADGNSEAHFFPLQAVNVPRDYNSANPEIKFAHLGYGVIKQDEVPTEPEISNPVTSVGTTLIIIFIIALANVWIIKHRNVPKEEAQIGD